MRLIAVGGCLVLLLALAVAGCGEDECDDTGACARPGTETGATRTSRVIANLPGRYYEAFA